MLLREWMTTDVITVLPQTSMMKAGTLLREHKFRRLPVVDETFCNRAGNIIRDMFASDRTL